MILFKPYKLISNLQYGKYYDEIQLDKKYTVREFVSEILERFRGTKGEFNIRFINEKKPTYYYYTYGGGMPQIVWDQLPLDAIVRGGFCVTDDMKHNKIFDILVEREK